MKKKDVTIDDLARMVQKEFSGIQKKLDRMDKNMTRLEKNDQTIIRELICI